MRARFSSEARRDSGVDFKCTKQGSIYFLYSGRDATNADGNAGLGGGIGGRIGGDRAFAADISRRRAGGGPGRSYSSLSSSDDWS